MKANEAIKKMMAGKNMSQQDMADALSKTLGKSVVRQTVNNRLNGDYGFSINTVLEYAAECGYELALIKKGKELPQDSFVINEKNEGKARDRKNSEK